ncbi:MAG: L,D-transpeptidase family protein [Clostridiales bacterium]|jgi:peptidoglycan hydrolase-like protein with peptidoglycan-binding domain|nr:L,D-transpeptidase family protein [Clostridiales bacterium]
MKRTLSFLLALMLLLPLVFAEQTGDEEGSSDDIVIVTSEGRALKLGDKGEDVKLLQTRLKDLRYYNGPVTGNYLQQTQRSIRAVQEAYGLETTGDADLNLQEIIYGDAHRPLQKGDTGKDVSRLQTRLSEIGYYWGKISSNYLDGTTAAVGNFQEDNGLEKTGKADVKTLIKLYSDDIVMPTPDPNTTPRPVPTPPADAVFTGIVSYGAKTKQVSQVQERLTALGFFDRKITGGYYEHTHAAVKKFQQYNGLVPDGIVGESTWNVLFSLDVVRADGVPKPSPTPAPIPYAVDVDVANQLIKVYGLDEKGEHTQLEKVFWCSTGTAGYPSRPGTYITTGRRAQWAHFPNWGGGTARWWVRIDSEIAFHSIIYANYDLKRPNMNSVRKLGSVASHGCIRLTLADAKWMYDNIRAGTKITIFDDAPLDPELKAAHKPGDWNKASFVHNATPAPTQQPHYDGSRPPADIRALKSGSTGEDVFWLQNKLKELGYFRGTVTGTYLDGTKQAVRAFQKDNRLNQNGTADKATLTALYEQVLASTTPAPTPMPTDPPGMSLPPVVPEAAPTVFTVETENP